MRDGETTRIKLFAGLAGVIAGIALIGTSGIAFALGWGLWLVGLVAVLGAVGTSEYPATVTALPGLEPAAVGDRQAA